MRVCLANIDEAYALSCDLAESWFQEASSFGEARKKSFLAGRALLQYLLRQEDPACNLPKISADERGKPIFKSRPDCHFNISHSGTLIVVSVGHHENGIDIERIKQRRQMDLLVQRVLSEGEKKILQTVEKGELFSKFFQLWTLRECLLKTSGRGLGGLDDIKIDLQKSTVFCPGVSCGCTWSMRTDDLPLKGMTLDSQPCYMTIYVPNGEKIDLCILHKLELLSLHDIKPESVFHINI